MTVDANMGLNRSSVDVSEASAVASENLKKQPVTEEERSKISPIDEKRVELGALAAEGKALISVNRPQIEEAVKVVSDFVNSSQRGLEFTVDEDAGRTVVMVMDRSDEKLIRQIPSEEVLKLSKQIKELRDELSQKTGMLFESEV